MKNDIKPIKRSAELAPLSREHHEGLLLGWKIKQGIKKEISVERISAYVQWFWQQHLQPHFKKEEVLLPQILPAENGLIQQMFSEHKMITNAIQACTENSTYHDLELVAESIQNHIRFEERILFNEVERVADNEQKQQLALCLEDHKVDAIWQDEFWIR